MLMDTSLVLYHYIYCSLHETSLPTWDEILTNKHDAELAWTSRIMYPIRRQAVWDGVSNDPEDHITGSLVD